MKGSAAAEVVSPTSKAALAVMIRRASRLRQLMEWLRDRRDCCTKAPLGARLYKFMLRGLVALGARKVRPTKAVKFA